MSGNIRINTLRIGFLRSANRRICSFLPSALAIIVSAFAVLFAYAAYLESSADRYWHLDFFGIWSFAKFVFFNRLTEIYDNSILLDFQMSLGVAPILLFPFAYPPFFILMILPLGVLSFGTAYVAWDIFTFSIYFLASYYRRWRRSAILVTIFAPAALLNFNNGETGFLSAGLILGGFRFTSSHPILSGVLFGLASFKPQLGILIPIALISARLWQPLVAGVATIAILIAVSSLVFGWSIWSMWLGKLIAHAEWAAYVPNRYQPTITANLTFLGVDLAIARMVQIVVALVVAIIIWVCFRRGVTLLATSALLVGTFLATPYALYYDMPILTNAVLMVIRHKDQTNRSLTVPEAVVLLVSLFVPIIMMNTWRPAMFRSIPLFLLLGLIVRDLFRFHNDNAKPELAPAGQAVSVHRDQRDPGLDYRPGHYRSAI